MLGPNMNIYSYGTYYNWPAAMASTTAFSSADESNNSGTSICPSGWQLPSGGTTGTEDIAVLNSAVNNGLTTESKGLRKYPNNFIYSGGQDDTTIGRGTTGYYSTRSWSGSTNSRLLYFTSSLVYSGSAGIIRYSGISVRCITAEGIETVLDANDNSNRTSKVYSAAGSSIILQSDQFVRSGYVITSWNTSPDGTGTSYTDIYQIAPGATTGTTLYAQWSPAYTIRYHGNGATGDRNMDYYAHLDVSDGETI
jgi:uncharacterized protein (TIGR02145 family)